jgi:hypothetical protein
MMWAERLECPLIQPETFISLPPLVDGGVTVGVVYKYIKKKKAFILYWK